MNDIYSPQCSFDHGSIRHRGACLLAWSAHWHHDPDPTEFHALVVLSLRNSLPQLQGIKLQQCMSRSFLGTYKPKYMDVILQSNFIPQLEPSFGFLVPVDL